MQLIFYMKQVAQIKKAIERAAPAYLWFIWQEIANLNQQKSLLGNKSRTSDRAKRVIVHEHDNLRNIVF